MILIEQTSVPSSALPIAQFRDHLRLGTGFSDDGVQDEILENCLRSAIAMIEGRTGKVLIEKTFALSVSAWRRYEWHPLPVAPVQTILSVSILDRIGTADLVDGATYFLRKDNAEPKLVSTGALPSIPDGGAAEIFFTAGYGVDWNNLPSDLLRAVYVLAADMYENRDGGRSGGGLPGAVDVLIERYRPVRITGGGV